MIDNTVTAAVFRNAGTSKLIKNKPVESSLDQRLLKFWSTAVTNLKLLNTKWKTLQKHSGLNPESPTHGGKICVETLDYDASDKKREFWFLLI